MLTFLISMLLLLAVQPSIEDEDYDQLYEDDESEFDKIVEDGDRLVGGGVSSTT